MTATATNRLRENPQLPEELAANIRHIAGLEQNWNGYDAPPIDADCIAQAVSMVKMALSINLTTPRLTPGDGAGIGIHWETERWELHVNLAPGQTANYVLDRRQPHGATEERYGVINNYADLRRIFRIIARSNHQTGV